MWIRVKLRQLISLPIQLKMSIALTNNQNEMLFCCSSSSNHVAGPNRTNFLEFR